MSSRIVAPSPYVGRFAPTPSGPLHLGSLVTAVASWWHARRVGGRWLLRIDDLDRQRCPPTAADRIKRQLSHCGLHWDGSAVHQRERIDHYRQGLQQLRTKGHVFPCNCTRAALRQRGPAGAAPYDGHCLQFPPTSGPLSLRFQPLPGGPVRFIDGQFGMQQRARQNCVGFPLWRVDDVPAYALAGAVDEAHLGVTEAVRGDDLLGETFSQLLVMDALKLPSPRWRHLPVVRGADGRKLSKQNHAAAVAETPASAVAAVRESLARIGWQVPADLATAPAAEQLAWTLNQPWPTPAAAPQ